MKRPQDEAKRLPKIETRNDRASEGLGSRFRGGSKHKDDALLLEGDTKEMIMGAGRL